MRNQLLGGLQRLLRWRRPATSTPPKTVLVLQMLTPLGCCVHGTPLYAALKRLAPGLRIVVAARGLGLATLQHHPDVDDLIEMPEPGPGFAGLWKAAAHLRRTVRARGIQPDLILQDANNNRGSFALLAALLQLAPTAGFAPLAPLYDHPFAYDPALSLIDNNLRLTALLGPRSPHLEPTLGFTTEELARARELLAFGDRHTPVTAFVVQGSGGQRTGWHDDRFATVLRHVASLGHRIVFLGAANDAPVIDRVRAFAGVESVSLAGQTSITGLAAVLALCDLLVTLDTGAMHVSRAVGTPMVVLGPSWQKPIEWLPLGVPQARILRGEDRDAVPESYRLDEIDDASVIAAADDLLAQYPPSLHAREQRAARSLSTHSPAVLPFS